MSSYRLFVIYQPAVAESGVEQACMGRLQLVEGY